MPIIQQILTICFVLAFLWLMLILAWYIAIPLLILFGLFYLFEWMRIKWQERLNRRQANGCTIHQTRSSKPAQTIIDVDYTEVD